MEKPKKKRGGKIEGAGGKRIPVDWNKVDEMLKAGCDGTVVAACLGMSDKTLARAIKEKHGVDLGAYKAQKRAEGAEALRLMMYRMAMKEGNTTERIFLSKNMLGFTDKQNTDFTSGGKPLKTEVTVRFEKMD